MPDAVAANNAVLPALEDLESRTTQAFNRAYSRWLAARAAVSDWPMPSKEMDARVAEEQEATMAFLMTPAAASYHVWQKLEAAEALIAREFRDGRMRYSMAMTALGSLKADIINLDLCAG